MPNQHPASAEEALPNGDIVMANSKVQKTQKLLVGADVGSTTTKIAAVDQISGELV